MSPGRRYRVLKRLPWIEGGRPAPGFQWEGGQFVVYQPGDTIYVDDRELASIQRSLEGLDEEGRAALEEIRAKAKGRAKQRALADVEPDTVEWMALRALEERRRAVREEGRVEEDYAVNRDGTQTLLSTTVYPANPLPGVVYDNYGLPLPYETALQRERLEMERKLADIHAGAKKGGKRGRATRRDGAARDNEALLADVEAERAKHPRHGRPAIAETLLPTHGRPFDPFDPADRKRAVAALTKRIERLEKPLDK